MNHPFRDYIDTVNKISSNQTIDFWEEELCYIFDKQRETQINYLGDSVEYLNDLIRRSSKPFIQENFLNKAIRRYVMSYRFDSLLHNFTEKEKTENFLTLLNITHEFCKKDKDVIQLYTDLIIAASNRLSNQAFQKNIFTSDLLTIYTSINYLVREYLPYNFDFSLIDGEYSERFNFLNGYFEATDHFLSLGGEFLSSSLVFQLKFNYPTKFTTQLLSSIFNEEEVLETLFSEFQTNYDMMENFRSKILVPDHKANFLRMCIDFRIPIKPFLSTVREINLESVHIYKLLAQTGKFTSKSYLTGPGNTIE